MPEVIAIEQAAHEWPWAEEEMMKVLRRRNCWTIVAEHNDLVVGFAIYRVRASEIRVLDLAVHPSYRRRQIGHQMVSKLIARQCLVPKSLIVLVRETNLIAQLFFRNAEFRAEEILRGFYKDTGEDAYLMEYSPEE
jgi:ribosomal-protein-alanine N-acetyltransferase